MLIKNFFKLCEIFYYKINKYYIKLIYMLKIFTFLQQESFLNISQLQKLNFFNQINENY